MPFDEAPDIKDETAIFEEALQAASPSDQEAILERLCGSDTRLLQRVRALLSAYERSESLEIALQEFDLSAKYPPRLVGEQVGRFEIVDLIGEGGMGEVYLAKQRDNPAVKVALKVIKPGMDCRQVLARFQFEHRALDRLVHPNIARYVDAGSTTSGRPYFAMELVSGLPITTFCDRYRMTVDQRLQLFLELCDAVGYAHEQGIVHRDLKPSNVLVTHIDGDPHVKVIDFGIGKALDSDGHISTRFTRPEQWLGTPAYASPEQALWSSSADARSDQFALAAILVELLTGSSPFCIDPVPAFDVEQWRQRILDWQPVRPSTQIKRNPQAVNDIARSRNTTPIQLTARLARDLDWIALKALEKQPNCRYANVGQLADDIRAAQEHRQPSVGPPGIGKRLFRFMLRHNRIVAAVAMFAVLISIVSNILLQRSATREMLERERAILQSQTEAESKLTHLGFVRDMASAARLLSDGAIDLGRGTLAKWLHSENPERESFVLNYLAQRLISPTRRATGNSQDILDIDISADRQWFATCDRGGEIVVTEGGSGRLIHRIRASNAEVTRARFSPDGRFLAATGMDRLLRIWRVNDWSELHVLDGEHEHTLNGLDWSPDSRSIIVGDRDGVAKVWDIESGTVCQILPKHRDVIRCLDWSADGKLVATAEGNLGVYIWDTQTWRAVTYVKAAGPIQAINFSADGKFLAMGGLPGGALQVVDLQSFQTVHRFTMGENIASVAFTTDDSLMVGGFEGTVVVLAAHGDGRTWRQVRRHAIKPNGRIRGIVPVPERNEVFFATESDPAFVSIPYSSLLGSRPVSGSLPLGDNLVSRVLIESNLDGGNAAVFSHDTDRVITSISGHVHRPCAPSFSAVRNCVAYVSRNDTSYHVNVMRCSDWHQVHRLDLPGPAYSLSFSRDGQYLVAAGATEYRAFVRTWHLPSEKTTDLLDVPTEAGSVAVAAFSPNADTMVCGIQHRHQLQWFSAGDFKPIRTMETESPWRAIQHVPGRNWLAIGETEQISVWNGEHPEMIWSSPVRSPIDHLAVSPDSDTIVSCSNTGELRCWDCEAQGELLVSAVPSQHYHWLHFRDARTLHLESSQGARLVESRTVVAQTAADRIAEAISRNDTSRSSDSAEVSTDVVDSLDKPMRVLLPSSAIQDPGSRWGTTVAASSAFFAVGSPYVDLHDRRDVGRVEIYAPSFVARLFPPEQNEGDLFGMSIAMQDDYILVGASGNANGAINNGVAYLFDTSTRKYLRTFRNPYPTVGARFGQTLAMAGNLAVIGAPGEFSTANLVESRSRGRVHLFDVATGNHLQEFDPPQTDGNIGYGRSVAIHGNYVAIGAVSWVSGSRGQVFLFDARSGRLIWTWTSPTPEASERFGASVAVQGNVIAVGAPQGGPEERLSGCVYLYSAISGQQIGTLQNPSPHPGDAFGSAVTMTKVNIVVGADGHDEDSVDSGRVFVYSLQDYKLESQWSIPSEGERFGQSVASGSEHMVVIGIPSDDVMGHDSGNASYLSLKNLAVKERMVRSVQEEVFGHSVAISDSYAVVGAHLDDSQAPDNGMVYVFNADKGTLRYELRNPLPVADEWFGHSVAVSEKYIAVSAPWNDSIAPNQGIVYLFDAKSGELLHEIRQPDLFLGRSFFVRALAISGDRIVVGAETTVGEGVTNITNAYIFDGQSGALSSTLELPHTIPGIYDHPVAIAGDIIAVGIVPTIRDGSCAGGVCLVDAGSGRLVREIKNPTMSCGFGVTLAMDSHNLIVGDPFTASANAAGAGKVYIFDRSTGGLLGEIIAPMPAPHSCFGMSVDIAENMIAVGELYNTHGEQCYGAAHLYDVSTRKLITTYANPVAGMKSEYGNSVAVSANRLIAGDWFRKQETFAHGAAYIYAIPNRSGH